MAAALLQTVFARKFLHAAAPCATLPTQVQACTPNSTLPALMLASVPVASSADSMSWHNGAQFSSDPFETAPPMAETSDAAAAASTASCLSTSPRAALTWATCQPAPGAPCEPHAILAPSSTLPPCVQRCTSSSLRIVGGRHDLALFTRSCAWHIRKLCSACSGCSTDSRSARG
eukprot:364779-Chlamydomonas_euryale.AAC.13